MDKSVKNFKYNGFYVSMLPGKAPYKVENLVQWTNDVTLSLPILN